MRCVLVGIDAVRRKHDAESYTVRSTPRRSYSNWSAVNFKLVVKLKKAGVMTPAGFKVYNVRNKKSNYSYEQPVSIALSKESGAMFRKNKKAWDYFQLQRTWYLKPFI